MLFKCARRAAALPFWSCGISSVVLLGSLWIAGSRPVSAQSQIFSSGSTGADGPLNIIAPGSTLFNPASIPNHKAGDTIFNFTTINIAAGSTLRLDSRIIPGPVYWLATGDVSILGTLDLSGQTGHYYGVARVARTFSVAGAGGFGGGPGGGSSVAAEPGAGPGGGVAAVCDGNGAPGVFSGSQYLIPLVGGSGGGGECLQRLTFADGGGAGGGAVLIASSTTITISGSGTPGNGSITAKGGNAGGGGSNSAGPGSGGAVRLIATTISINGYYGNIDVSGGTGNGIYGGAGFLRLEAFNVSVNGQVPTLGNGTTSTPFKVSLPQGGPSTVQVVRVNGVPITTNPFTFPDAPISTSIPVPVVIQALNVPPGAIPTLTIVSESGPDQVISAPALVGTLASSTSTVNIAYPPGGSQGLVKVTWSN